MPRAHLRGLVVSAIVVLAIVVSVPREEPAYPRQPPPKPNAKTHVTSAVAPVANPAGPAQGIDVGDYQHSGGPIQWTAVASQYQFAYVKATEGTNYMNQYYASDVQQAQQAGLYVGGYAFATPDSASGADEANYFLQQTNYTKNPKLMVPMIDLEWNPYASGTGCWLDPTDLVAWITDYSNTIWQALGVHPIIYTQASFWNDCTGGSSAFYENPLWVGSIGSQTTTLPTGFTSWMIWQNGVGSASGVSGPVDTDAFNGTVAQLKTELTDPVVPLWPRSQPLQAYAASYRRR